MDDGNERKIFDRQQMLDNIDGDTDLLKTLCREFINTQKASMDDIRAAVSNKDAASLAAAAHKFKGSVANFYAQRAREAAAILEDIGKNARFEKADAALPDLEKEVQSLITALEKEIQRDDKTGISGQDIKAPVASAQETGISGEREEGAVSNFGQLLKDLGGDRRLFREIGAAFLKTCGQGMEAIGNAAHSKNSAELIGAANAFKGMVSEYHAERVTAAAEALARRGQQENFDGVEAALEKLENEVKLFCDELQAAISYETTEAEDAISKKKGDVLDLVEELRISVETTYTLKNAIQHRMDDLETKLNERDDEFAKLCEEFESLRDTMRNTETSQAAPSASMLQMAKEMNDKISAIEREFIGGKEELALTRKDLHGIIGMLKDFRKMFYALIARFGSHIAEHNQEKIPSDDKHESQWRVKKYKYKGL